ncbi:MAG: alpha/beta hydrolase [Propionibacteriaceae bacterium]|jgi:pimeloyl-ACP methyl ester carboxylesterase|nr:alpha/beta hydrolase [Propionibacteriaceae bacterium]
MPYADNNGTAIFYETQGPASGHPTVLIEGLSKQLLGWKPAFRDRLEAGGAFVIALDNRDVGLSHKFGGRQDLVADYTLFDMALDVAAVLDHLGLPAAHLVGQSMGGAIAQALLHVAPERVASITGFYTVGDARHMKSTGQGDNLTTPQPDRTRDEYVEFYLAAEANCASTLYPFDLDWHTGLAKRSYDRCYAPDGMARQASAVMGLAAQPGPAGFVGQAPPDLPMAFIHGRADRLVDYHASIELAEEAPAAELHLYPGLGHEIPAALITPMADTVLRTVRRGSARERR